MTHAGICLEAKKVCVPAFGSSCIGLRVKRLRCRPYWHNYMVSKRFFYFRCVLALAQLE